MPQTAQVATSTSGQPVCRGELAGVVHRSGIFPPGSSRSTQNIEGKIYVTHAPAGLAARAAAPGAGFISVFDENGAFLQRLVWQCARGTLGPRSPRLDSAVLGDPLVGNFSFASSVIKRSIR
jgi:hypothetical protein